MKSRKLNRLALLPALFVLALFNQVHAGEDGQDGDDYPTVTSRHVAVFVIDFPDATPAVRPTYPTPAEFEDMLFGSSRRLAAWFETMSYGAFSFTGEVFGYFTHQNPGFVDGRIVELDEVLKIDSIVVPGFDLNDYDGVVLLSVHDLGLAGARGASGPSFTFDINGSEVSTAGVFAPYRVDSSSFPINYIIPTGEDASIEGPSTIDISHYERIFAHEVIHYLGVNWHANTRTNGGSFDYEPEVPGNFQSGSSFPLINWEYGNYYDAMGRGFYGASLNSVFRDRLGWTNVSNRYSIKAYGQHTVTLWPINSLTGFRSVEIRIPFDYADFAPRKNKGYFLEVRTGADEWDNMLLHPELLGSNDGIMVLKTDGANSHLMDMSPSPNFPFYGQTTPDTRDVVLKPGMAYENDQIRLSNVIDNGDGSFTVDVDVKVPTDIMVTAQAAPNAVSELGDTLTMVASIENLGSSSVTLTNLSHTDYADLDGIGTCVLPQTLAPGAPYDCSFSAFVEGNAGFVAKTVSATAGGESASYTTAVTVTDALPLVEVTSSASPTTVPQSGDAVTFTVQIQNNSGASDPVTVETLSDDVFGDLSSRGSCSLPQVVTAGGAYQCSYAETVSGPTGSMQTNTTTANGMDDESNIVQAQDSSTVTIDPGAPEIPEASLSLSTNAGSEAAMTDITVTATTGQPVTGDQTLDVLVTGTNITASDYILTDDDAGLAGNQIVIPDGQTMGSVTFTVVDDDELEGTETAVLTIANPSAGVQLGPTTTQIVSITDDDAPASVEVNLTVNPVEAFESDMTQVTVRALVSGFVTGDQVVDLAISGVDVTAEDYTITDGNLGEPGIQIVIPDSTSQGTVTFTVSDDDIVELEERVTFTISNPSPGISLGPNPTQDITIGDNDVLPDEIMISNFELPEF